MRRGLPLGIAVLAALAATAGVAAAAGPRVSAPTVVVPSAGLPPQVHDNRSNNNVHVVRHRGRFYMVWRTAKWHIASEDAVLYVVSSRDQRHWRFEGGLTHRAGLPPAPLPSVKGRPFLY